MTTNRLRKLKEDLLEYCKLDYVGLWLVASTVREDLSLEHDDEVLEISLAVIREFLEEGLVVVGQPDWEVGKLELWEGEPEWKVARIRKEWRQLGRDPDHLEICWLTTTEKGDQWVEEHIEG